MPGGRHATDTAVKSSVQYGSALRIPILHFLMSVKRRILPVNDRFIGVAKIYNPLYGSWQKLKDIRAFLLILVPDTEYQ